MVGKEGFPKGNPSKGFPLAVFRPFLAAERDGLRGLSAKRKKISTKQKIKTKSSPTTSDEKIWPCSLSDIRKNAPARPEHHKEYIKHTQAGECFPPPVCGLVWVRKG